MDPYSQKVWLNEKMVLEKQYFSYLYLSFMFVFTSFRYFVIVLFRFVSAHHLFIGPSIYLSIHSHNLPKKDSLHHASTFLFAKQGLQGGTICRVSKFSLPLPVPTFIETPSVSRWTKLDRKSVV